MKEFLKKSWFVVLIGAILFGVAGYMTWDFMSQQLPSKKVDNKDVVFSYSGIDFTADELYDALYDQYSLGTILNYLELYVYRNAFEPDADLLSEAKLQANGTIQNLQYQYGEEYKEILDRELKKIGYSGASDLQDYWLTILMREEAQKNYILSHFDEYFPKYAAERMPRKISHILVAFADIENPTEEELAKLEEVKSLLAADGSNFAEIAIQYSDDTGSGVEGGSLGVVDLSTISNYVANFKNHVYTVNEGEMTEWFATEYGYHIIYVDSENPEDFKDDPNLINYILSYYPNLSTKITWLIIEELDLELIGDEEIISQIKEYYNVEIDTTVPTNDGGNE